MEQTRPMGLRSNSSSRLRGRLMTSSRVSGERPVVQSISAHAEVIILSICYRCRSSITSSLSHRLFCLFVNLLPPDVIGKRVSVRLNSGIDYRGTLSCLDGYMNIAMEETSEWVGGVEKNRFGDAFIRGNNGECGANWRRKKGHQG